MFYEFVKNVVKAYLKVCFFTKIKGVENVPKDGAFILASNHISNYDPPMIAASCPRKLTFMAKEELFQNPVLGLLLKKLGAFPIKRGQGDLAAIKNAFSILKSGNVMLMFPQGRRMKDNARGKAQSGVAMIAHKMQVPIVPVYISGEYRLFKRVTVTFGEPILLTEYYNQKVDSETMKGIAEEVLDKIYSYDVGGELK